MSYRRDSYADRLAQEKKVNIYFIPYEDDSSKKLYAYVAASALLHDKFMAALEFNQIPDFAVVVARGEGEPTTEVKDMIKRYYGFDHDHQASLAGNDNASANGS